MSAKRAERLQVMLTIDEVRRVEEWRFEKRMPSRSAAVRALMNLGLKADAAVDESALLEGAVHSRDVGVVEAGPVAGAPVRRPDGPAVLVLEGEPLAGEGIRHVLEKAGFQVLGPAADEREAEILAAASQPGAAVLDAGAGAESLAAVADRLAERGVPFLMVTTKQGPALPQRHEATPAVSRSQARQKLGQAVSALLR